MVESMDTETMDKKVWLDYIWCHFLVFGVLLVCQCHPRGMSLPVWKWGKMTKPASLGCHWWSGRGQTRTQISHFNPVITVHTQPKPCWRAHSCGLYLCPGPAQIKASVQHGPGTLLEHKLTVSSSVSSHATLTGIWAFNIVTCVIVMDTWNL